MMIATMKVWIYILATAAMLVCGCEGSFTREVAVPLNVQPAEPNGVVQHISGLDVQAAVEKIASDAGLQPYVADSAEDDLFGVAGDIIDTPAANTRTWKHPDRPLFLSMTRQKGEYLLLLNVAEEKPDAATKKLYKQLEKQLAALPVELTAATLETEQK